MQTPENVDGVKSTRGSNMFMNMFLYIDISAQKRMKLIRLTFNKNILKNVLENVHKHVHKHDEHDHKHDFDDMTIMCNGSGMEFKNVCEHVHKHVHKHDEYVHKHMFTNTFINTYLQTCS